MDEQRDLFIIVEFYNQPEGRWETILPDSLYLGDPVEFNYENDRLNRNDMDLLKIYGFFLPYDEDIFSIFGGEGFNDSRLSNLRGLPLNTSIVVPLDIIETTFFGYDELVFMDWDPLKGVENNTKAKKRFLDIMEMLRSNVAKPSTEIRLGFLFH